MEIKTTNIDKSTDIKPIQTHNNSNLNKDKGFSEELKNLDKTDSAKNIDKAENDQNSKKINNNENNNIPEKNPLENKIDKDDNVEKALNKLNDTVIKISNTGLNQSDENELETFKNDKQNTDTEDKGEELINNDFEISKRQEIQAQVSTNLNFSSNNQDFSSLMNNENTKESELNSSAKDLEEEAEILSTMAENIAIANKNKIKTVVKNDGMQKINTKTNIVVEDVVKFDSIVMNKDDVEFFANLVENNQVNLNEYSTGVEGASRISKTLADMLAKSMENNKPLRIDFDNNISVIIKIDREGKISADFLPSSQVAEAYLKENLPLLKQRFDENNINYGELNQRNQRDRERDNNRRKDRNNE